MADKAELPQSALLPPPVERSDDVKPAALSRWKRSVQMVQEHRWDSTTAMTPQHALELIKAALAAGDSISAIHHCHAGIELLEAAAATNTPVSKAAEYSALRTTLVSQLDELERQALEQEQSLTHLPEVLVGVGYPGNNIADGVTSGDTIGITNKVRAGGSALALWWASVRNGGYISTEWALRVAVSCGLAVALALHGLYLPPVDDFVNTGLMTVLATAQAKPTLGDALEGTWIALSGATMGLALMLPLVPIGCLSAASAIACYAIVTFVLVFAFGDHVQARWGLLVALLGVVKAAKGAGLLAAYVAMGRAVMGFAFGCGFACFSLLAPFPRLAYEQLGNRIAEAHRQAMRFHAVLSVAFVESDEPHVLYGRALNLSNSLKASLTNLNNLATVARWEQFLLPRNDAALLSSHAALLEELGTNLESRYAFMKSTARSSAWHRRVVDSM